ncbi:MAG TPA: hypothetical protein VE264_00305 [Nitrososphaera sp.]|nr:hypothetical protein [Nitrososphaera sp.]
MYRNRALWVGAVGMFFALLVLSTILIGTFASTNRFLILFQFGLTNFGAILVFGWIDSNVRVARRSDPLRRNTLHWTKLRIFIWAILTIALVGGLFSAFVGDINYLSSPAGLGGAFLDSPFTPAAAFGIVALAVSHRRINDVTLKRHIKWLVFFVLILLFATRLLEYSSSLFSTVGFVAILLLACGAYFLYIAARSLSQLDHLKPNVVARNLK